VELTGNKYARGDWRKVLATRRGTVLVAAVCALIAAGAMIFAMQRYRHNVVAENNPATVFVANGLIQKGTSGDAIAAEQLFKPTSVAGKQVAAGAIADATQLHGKVATADIYPGQQLTASDFTGTGGLTAQLTPNQRAMTIAIDTSRGMVGQVHVGDHVDVYADLESGSGHGQPFVRLVLTNVPVLKAGSTASGAGLSSTNNQQNQLTNVTLKVNDNQVGALAFAADNGKVWLVLRPANATTTPASAVSVQSLLTGAGSGGAR
jgi:Flp pilus assembly protein CpaB